MKANARLLSNESYILWNDLYNRAFSFSCLFLGIFLQDSIYYAINSIRSFGQTEFVYLFMPRHRHAAG